MMPDHIHLLLRIPSKQSASQIMGYLKGKSAMMIFEWYANLKYIPPWLEQSESQRLLGAGFSYGLIDGPSCHPS